MRARAAEWPLLPVVQTDWVSIGASEQPHRTRHTALGRIPSTTSPRWEFLHLAGRVSRRRWARTQVQLSALLQLVLHPPDHPKPERFLSQFFFTAGITSCRHVHALMSFQFCVGPYLLPAVIMRSCSPCIFALKLGLKEERRLTFRPPVTLERFHVQFSRSWLLCLVPVEQASTWVSNLNSADTTSAFGIVLCSQTLIRNAHHASSVCYRKSLIGC